MDQNNTINQTSVIEVKNQLGFGEGLECWVFNPRINRIKFHGLSAFWNFFFFLFPLLSLGKENIESLHIYLGLTIMLLIFPNFIGLIVRRLHDLNRSAWWSILLLIPIIGQAMGIIISFWSGTKGSNKFGPQTRPAEKRYYFMLLLYPLLGYVYYLSM
jgi:uncharacterized membrane protein YhaH (DUF805 family)